MSRDAEKRGFGYCDETCPAVGKTTSDFLDGEFDKFIERVKEVSAYKLREGLNEACADLISAESEIKELKAEIERQRDVIEDLKQYVAELRQQELA